MPSFTRTIPQYKTNKEVEMVLSGRDGFVPLTFRPGRAGSGDFIYMIYHGFIAGRARISKMIPAQAAGYGGGQVPGWAKWLVYYKGGWEIPPREITVQGHQGVRYLEEQGLGALDGETWQEFGL